MSGFNYNFGVGGAPQTSALLNSYGRNGTYPTEMYQDSSYGGLIPPMGESTYNPATMATDLDKYGMGGGIPASKGWFTQDNMDTFGAGAKGIGSLVSAWAAIKGLGVAKDNLAFQKDAFNKQFDAQAGLTNAALEKKYRSQAASYANNHQAMDRTKAQYMAEYGIKR